MTELPAALCYCVYKTWGELESAPHASEQERHANIFKSCELTHPGENVATNQLV